MVYGDFKDLKRRTASKVLTHKTFNIAKNLKYYGYQRGLTSMVYKFFDKKLTGSGVNIPSEFNKQLAKELRKPIIKKFQTRKVYSGFKDNIWGADLVNMQLISKFRFLDFLNLDFYYAFYFYIFSKYAWVFPLKDKKGASVINAFQKMLEKSGRKLNKIWVDKGIKFYNSSLKNG